MATLSRIDKMKLEKLLEMESGYVIDFSNRTFQEFVEESTGIDIYDDKYCLHSGSKANRLRAFWDIEPPHLVAKLLSSLLEYYKYTRLEDGQYLSTSTCEMLSDYIGVIEKLQKAGEGSEIETLNIFSARRNFEELSVSIARYISENQFALALDRLHTFTVRYLRLLGEKYSYPTSQEMPLHSLMGSYIKAIKSHGIPIHEMTERILKTSISQLESFNDVRNNSSYAHDNVVLGEEESRFIVGSISNLVRYIDSIEKPKKETSTSQEEDDNSDIPF